MIDLHSHILPGLDDGASDLATSLEMLRAMVADGIRTVVATPHVREDFPTTVAEMRDALDVVRQAAAEDGLPIEILPGGEVSIEALTWLSDGERRGFGLGGRDDLLLLETPYHGWSSAIGDAIVRLRLAGVTVVLAHPERNPVVQDRPSILERLVRDGVLVQLTAASLEGVLGRTAQLTARALLEARLAHTVASDAHGPGVREVGLSRVGAAVGGDGLAAWLTQDVPRWLLVGHPVVGRPDATRKSWRDFLRR